MSAVPTPSSSSTAKKRLTVPQIQKQKGQSRLSVLTAYDWTMASLFDEAGVDMLLVGDSLGMVVQGADSTLGVTLDEMIYHTKMVVRGSHRALVIGDMPFLSYHGSIEQATLNAGRFLAEGGATAVKLEGGKWVAPLIRAMVTRGIPVMGHLGLLPQSMHTQGGFRVQGKDADSRAQIISDALELEAAGAFSVVLEGIPKELAQEITHALKIPTIGIGAGAECDGQVLVAHDMLGLRSSVPKFVKEFGKLRAPIIEAAQDFISQVKAGAFPADEHTYSNKAL